MITSTNLLFFDVCNLCFHGVWRRFRVNLASFSFSLYMERNTEKLKLASVDLQSKKYTLDEKGKSMLFFPLFWTILFDRCISIQALIIRCYAMSCWRFPKKLGLPVVWTKQPQRKRQQQQQQQQAIKIRKVKLRHGNAVKLQSYLCRQPSTNSQRISPKLAQL